MDCVGVGGWVGDVFMNIKSRRKVEHLGTVRNACILGNGETMLIVVSPSVIRLLCL